MRGAPVCWRELRAGLRDLGGYPLRTKGSHEMWRLPSGEMFLVVRNHLGRRVPRNVVARYRRLRVRSGLQGLPPIPVGVHVSVTGTTDRWETEMSKSKSRSSNRQRSNTKNPNNSAYRSDRANRVRQAHPNPPPAPPMTTQDKNKNRK